MTSPAPRKAEARATQLASWTDGLGGVCFDPTPMTSRILLIKPDHLGDLLLATPALHALRQALPNARIVGLVGPWARRIWQGSPDLDALSELPFPGFTRTTTRRRSLQPYLLLLHYSLLLRRYHFDAALILRDDHWWGAALAAAAAIPQRIGHAHPRCSPFLTTALPYDPREHVTHQALAVVAALTGTTLPPGALADQSAPNHNESHRSITTVGVSTDRLFSMTTKGAKATKIRLGEVFLRALHPLRTLRGFHQQPVRHSSNGRTIGYRLSAISYGTPPTRFTPTPAEQAWANAWYAAQLDPGERLVVIHPGTGGPTKHWPPANWASVAEILAAMPATRLLFTGGPGEAALVAEVAGLVQQPTLSLVGQTSVGQLAALLGRAALVLGVDSGPLHLAVSQGTPSIHLYGPSDQLRFGPWGDPARHRVLRAGIVCSPCGVFAACPRATVGPECMSAISPAAVIAAAQELLSSL
jgi:ADP-heptose:LPS heptosyltransferase